MDFTALVDTHYRGLYQFAFSLAHSEADASDLTQETFLRWAQEGGQLRDTGKVKISADDLPADLAEPLLASANGWQTLTWKQDGRIMQLIAQTTPEKLRQLVLPG